VAVCLGEWQLLKNKAPIAIPVSKKYFFMLVKLSPENKKKKVNLYTGYPNELRKLKVALITLMIS
jgi:hypothetical protein